MIILSLLAACCIPLPDFGSRTAPQETQSKADIAPLPPPPPSLGVAAQSLAARPTWAGHGGYAPQGGAGLLDMGTPVQGAVSDGLIACTLTSDIRETRILPSARYPDLEATLSFGTSSIFAANRDNSATMTITAPLASLAPGSILRLDVRDRQLLGRRKLGVLETGYVGLPIDLQATDLHGHCVWVDRDTLEQQLVEPLRAAAKHTAAWRPAPTLEDPTLSPDGQGEAAAAALRTAASLVGWADPRVHSRVQSYQRPWQKYHDILGLAAGRRAAKLPAGWTTVMKGLAWAPAGLVEHGNIDMGLSDKEFGVLLPLRTATPLDTMSGQLGGLADAELVDSLGSHWKLRLQSSIEDGGSPHLGLKLSRQGVVVLAGIEQAHLGIPALPALVRARVGEQWVFQRVQAGDAVMPGG
ncbi:MAG: hypothetical protein GXP62_14360 [Oligoflexia bacterium]|nr:hypothetical protein [Oligoflexia bacterium]